MIGQREYSSNHYPWRLLAGKGYDVRQVPFRNGGLEPDDIARRVDGGTALSVFDDFGPGAIYARNRELTASLQAALAGIGWDPAELPEQNQSTIVSVPLGGSAHRGFSAHCPGSKSSARRGMATCGWRFTSTTTKTTSSDS